MKYIALNRIQTVRFIHRSSRYTFNVCDLLKTSKPIGALNQSKSKSIKTIYWYYQLVLFSAGSGIFLETA